MVHQVSTRDIAMMSRTMENRCEASVAHSASSTLEITPLFRECNRALNRAIALIERLWRGETVGADELLKQTMLEARLTHALCPFMSKANTATVPPTLAGRFVRRRISLVSGREPPAECDDSCIIFNAEIVWHFVEENRILVMVPLFDVGALLGRAVHDNTIVWETAIIDAACAARALYSQEDITSLDVKTEVRMLTVRSDGESEQSQLVDVAKVMGSARAMANLIIGGAAQTHNYRRGPYCTNCANAYDCRAVMEAHDGVIV